MILVFKMGLKLATCNLAGFEKKKIETTQFELKWGTSGHTSTGMKNRRQCLKLARKDGIDTSSDWSVLITHRTATQVFTDGTCEPWSWSQMSGVDKTGTGTVWEMSSGHSNKQRWDFPLMDGLLLVLKAEL